MLVVVSSFVIRTYGDPVLRQATQPVAEIDGSVAKLVEDMIRIMATAPGVGLAANQIGISKNIFVYDAGHGPGVVINAAITESEGEWTYEEGCLSVPGLYWPIVRPRRVHLEGVDLEGNPVAVEATDFLARIFQHEVDHLHGILLVERLDDEQLKAAKRDLRRIALGRF